jgi:hypothetical protein
MRTATKKPDVPASVQRYIGVEWGQPAPGNRIPIDTPMHISQRPYRQQNVYKYISRVGGLDWNLFGYATAVRRKSDQAMAVINGQHRINLAKIVVPGLKDVPAHIIDVDDQEFETYASALFSQFNGQTQKSLTNEELFHSQVLALDPEALHMKTVLEHCDLSCGTVNFKPTTTPVVYATFAKCLKLSETATVRAVELMKQGFKTVADDPLHGLVFLLSLPTYSVLGDAKTKIGKDFETWFTQAVPMFHSLSDLKFKKYRNNPSWQKGIAYGLVKNFNNYQRKHSRTAGPKISEIKKIYESGFKDEDSGLLD